MENAYICDAIRTPIGRYGGVLSAVRADDLAAIPIAALVARNRSVDWNALDDVIYGCANQSGEDNRNVARMALLLAGLPVEVPGSTVNRLCGSSMDAVASAARAIKSGEEVSASFQNSLVTTQIPGSCRSTCQQAVSNRANSASSVRINTFVFRKNPAP